MFIYIFLTPILIEILLRILNLSPIFNLIKILPLLIFINSSSKGVSNIRSLIAFFIFIIIILSQILYNNKFYGITFIADLFVTIIFLTAIILKNLDFSIEDLKKLPFALILSSIINALGAILGTLNAIGFSLLPDLVTPLEHSLRNFDGQDINLISGFFSSSKELAKFSTIGMIASLLSHHYNKDKLSSASFALFLLAVITSGSREGIYLSLTIVAYKVFSKNFIYSLKFLFISAITITIISYIGYIDFLFDNSKDASSRASGLISFILNPTNVDYHGLGLVGRSVSLLGLENIEGVTHYSYHGAVHDSGLFWLFTSFSYFSYLIMGLLCVLLTICILNKKYHCLYHALFMAFFVKAFSTIYDFYFTLMLLTFLPSLQKSIYNRQ